VKNTSIVARVVLVSAIVAAVAVVVAGLVALPLVRSSAESTARAELAGLSNLVAVAVINQGGQAIVPPGLYEELQDRNIDAYVVTGATSVPPDGVTVSEVTEVTSGQSVSSVGQASNGNVYVEGRPIGVGRGVLLVQPTSISGGPVAALLLRISLALLAGLVIAVVVGVVAARRITRPLRRVAEAAERLGAGDRDVSLPVDGPAEVVGIAEAINVLARELSASESRQRDFLLSVSHELRTPLTAIRGYAEALADGVITDAARTGVVIGEESARLDRLVTDLLDLARLRADTFRVTNAPVDLVHLIQEAGHVWADRGTRVGVIVHVEVGVRTLPLVTDAVRIRQIVDNLAENSMRVVPAGKAVVLALRVEPGWVVVEVRDAGPGLTEQDCVDAFEPGVLHERYRGIRAGGSGLGLALVARLAELLGGQASAGIAPEGGARFTVRLPRRTSA
jgi:two-component system sensor histidine kinase BaeS